MDTGTEDLQGQFVWTEMDFFAMARHAKGVNILFFDGSVREARARELWQFPWHRNWDFAAANQITFPGWMN